MNNNIFILKSCPECKKEFQTYTKRNSSNKKFCSKLCYKLYLKHDKETINRCLKIAQSGGQTRWKNHIYSYMANGYRMIKVVNHPFANKRGYVYEHRLAMEKELGRYLQPQEVIHHIDGIKLNNKIKNLKLFSTTNEHTTFHGLRGDLR